MSATAPTAANAVARAVRREALGSGFGAAARSGFERLAENGVERVYGYPGDGINAIIGALERHKDKLKFVQVHHEEQSAFMACAHAKWTGEVGVCLVSRARPARNHVRIDTWSKAPPRWSQRTTRFGYT